MTNSYKKEYPFVGYAGFGGGAGAFSYKSASDKKYVDDVFKTYLYTGAGETQTITNGMDLSASGDGGMVWIKDRSASNNHNIFDTVRGVNKVLSTSQQYPYGAEGTMGGGLQQFNSDGWQFGYEGGAFLTLNASGNDYSSWTFMKKEGFLDIVTYTGTGSAQNISHSLGSIPGVIIIKGRNNASQWTFWHKDIGGADDYMDLNMTDSKITNSNYFASTLPTSTQFTVGTDAGTNGSGNTYVAYVFAGGASTAATARSVDFDGSGDYLTVAGPGALGTSTDFTMECWVYLDDNAQGTHHRIFSANEGVNGTEFTQFRVTGGEWNVYIGASGDRWTWSGGTAEVGQWYHLALVRNGTTNAFYVNGVLQSSATGSHDVTITTLVIAGGYGTENINGKVSNARFVNGTAVYTSSFRPPTEPLTSITNTTLLCCNNSSTTGKTTGGTITANGDPTASTDSPFDDPAGFAFGEGGDQNIVKMGKYTGNGSSTAVDINIGWEPQWLLIKCNDLSSENWFILDSMRGIVDGAAESTLSPNVDTSEASIDAIDLTPTGFKTQTADDKFNGNGHEYIYMAIRRPDGLVGKPVEAGTDVFAMAVGQGGSSAPNYPGGIVIDYQLTRDIDSVNNWYTGARLIGKNYLTTNLTQVEAISSSWVYDYMNGYNTGSSGSDWQSWQWQRHAGFDVVTDRGDGQTTKQMAHGLGVVPEMIWRKNRDGGSDNWQVYHKDLNSGTNPQLYRLYLNTNNMEMNDDYTWTNAPTATHFTVGANGASNRNGDDFYTMLFSSVTGISKVGSYDGTGSVGLQITTGFSPRFLILKKSNGSGPWYVLDTTRGWAAGNDQYLLLDTSDAQVAYEFGAPNATGFQLDITASQVNESGGKYIYYAHA